jgi:hypothetical protein
VSVPRPEVVNPGNLSANPWRSNRCRCGSNGAAGRRREASWVDAGLIAATAPVGRLMVRAMAAPRSLGVGRGVLVWVSCDERALFGGTVDHREDAVGHNP